MSSDARDSDLTHQHANLARIHASDIVSLPEPPDDFRWRDQDAPLELLYRLYHRQVLEKTVRRSDPDNEEGVSKYRVKPEVYNVATDYAEYVDTLPCCESTGIVNDGGTIRCKRCGEVVDRETARRVIA